VATVKGIMKTTTVRDLMPKKDYPENASLHFLDSLSFLDSLIYLQNKRLLLLSRKAYTSNVA